MQHDYYVEKSKYYQLKYFEKGLEYLNLTTLQTRRLSGDLIIEKFKKVKCLDRVEFVNPTPMPVPKSNRKSQF